MAYEPTEWKAGDVITGSKMNKIEAQLAANTEEIEEARGKGGSASGSLGARIDDMIILSDTQPTSTDNEIWIRSSSSGGIVVPTYEELENVRDSIAEVYDSTKTYAIGDYAYYNEVLYRCTTAITTAESWNSGHWTEVKVGSEVKDAKNGVTAVDSNFVKATATQSFTDVQKNTARTNINAANSDVIADTYDATKTYAVGDYVIYNGKLYRCNTAISTAEAWTAAHWTETQMTDDVADLKSAIDEADTLLEISPFPVSGGGTLTVASEGVNVVEAMLKANTSYTITCTLAEATTKVVYLYLKKKSDSSNISTNSIAIGDTTKSFNVSVSEDTNAYVRFSVSVAPVTLTATIDTKYSANKRNVVDEVKNNTSGVNLGNVTVYPTWEKGGIDNATGETNNDGSAVRSRIAKYFRPNELVKVENNTTNSVLWIIYYTKNGGSYVFNNSESVNAGGEKSFTGNPYYIRFDLRSGIEYTEGIVFTATGIIKEELNALDNRVSDLENAEPGLSKDNSNIVRKMVPDYFFGFNANPDSFDTNEYLNQKIDTIPGTIAGAFFTDVHWATNAKHSPEIIQYLLSKKGKIPVLFGGDIVNAASDKYLGYQELLAFTNVVKDAFGDTYYPVLGDHDNNAVHTESPEDLAAKEIPFVNCYDGIFGQMPDNIHAISESTLSGLTLTTEQYNESAAYLKMNYYFDNEDVQTRYIFITSGMGDMGALTTAFGISNVGYQIYLVLNFLYASLMSTPEGYNVVLVTHNLFEDDTTDPDDKKAAPPNSYLMMPIRMLWAFKNKENRYIAGTNNISNQNLLDYFSPDVGDSGYKTYKSYYFSDAPTVGKIVVLSGDVHYNASMKTSGSASASITAVDINSEESLDENQILMISTQTDCWQYVTPSSTCYPMSHNTITEQTIDVLSFYADKVNLTRIGAGYDREFTFAALS